MGGYHPEQDIADYLKSLGIIVEQPSEPSNVSRELYDAVTGYWHEVHDKRRLGKADAYSLAVDRLARHDAENTLAVLSSRLEQDSRTSFGYSTWWLTLDKAALRMTAELNRDDRTVVRHSPVLSLDFFLKYLAFGPSRDLVHDIEKNAARVFSAGIIEALPTELLTVAEQVRMQCSGLSERII